MTHTEIIALRIFYFITFVPPLGSKKIMFRYNEGQFSDNNLLLTVIQLFILWLSRNYFHTIIFYLYNTTYHKLYYTT